MGAKHLSFCKHCDERGTVRVKRGGEFVMEKCRKCGGSGYVRAPRNDFSKQTNDDGDSNGTA